MNDDNTNTPLHPAVAGFLEAWNAAPTADAQETLLRGVLGGLHQSTAKNDADGFAHPRILASGKSGVDEDGDRSIECTIAIMGSSRGILHILLTIIDQCNLEAEIFDQILERSPPLIRTLLATCVMTKVAAMAEAGNTKAAQRKSAAENN